MMLDHHKDCISYLSEKFRKELEKMRSHPGYDVCHVSTSLCISKRVKRGLEKYSFIGPDCIAIVRLLYDPKTKVSWIRAINDPYETGATTISEFLHEFHDKNDFSSFIWERDDLNGGTCIVSNLSTATYPMYNCTRHLYIGEIDPAWEQVRVDMLQNSKAMNKLLGAYLSDNFQSRIGALIKLGVFNLELLTINNNFGFRVALHNRVDNSSMPDDIKDVLLNPNEFKGGDVTADFLNPYAAPSSTNMFSAAKKMCRQLPYILPGAGTPAQHKRWIFRSQALFPLLYCSMVPNAVIQENSNSKRYRLLTYKELKTLLMSVQRSEIDLDLDPIKSNDCLEVHLEDIDLI